MLISKTPCVPLTVVSSSALFFPWAFFDMVRRFLHGGADGPSLESSDINSSCVARRVALFAVFIGCERAVAFSNIFCFTDLKSESTHRVLTRAQPTQAKPLDVT